MRKEEFIAKLALSVFIIAVISFIAVLLALNPIKEIAHCTGESCSVKRVYYNFSYEDIILRKNAKLRVEHGSGGKGGSFYYIDPIFTDSYFFKSSAQNAFEKISGEKEVKVCKYSSNILFLLAGLFALFAFGHNFIKDIISAKKQQY